MDSARFSLELSTQITACYPLIVLQSREEPWVVELVESCARRAGRGFVLCDRGIGELEALLLEHAAGAVLLCVHQAQDFLERCLPTLLRHSAQPTAQSTLVIVGSDLRFPPALQMRLSRLRVPMPSQSERAAIIASRLKGDVAGVVDSLAYHSAGLTRVELMRFFAYCDAAGMGQGSLVQWQESLNREKRRLFGELAALSLEELGGGMEMVGGMQDLKAWLALRKPAFSKRAVDFGLPAPKGLLLVGVQGCGKSLVSRAIAAFWQFSLLRLDLGALFSTSMPPEAAFLQALDVAETMAPVTLWIDEIEKAFSAGDAVSMRIMGSLLQWLQNKRAPVFVVATANQIEALPPELVRKGRFDEVFFVDLPDAQARQEIFAIHLARRGREPAQFDLSQCVQRTQNFSGAEIEECVVSALHKAFAQERELRSDDIFDAIHETVTLYQQREDEIKALREWARGRTRFAEDNKRLLGLFS